MCFHTSLRMIDNAFVFDWLGDSCFVHGQVGLPRGQDNTIVVGIEMV